MSSLYAEIKKHVESGVLSDECCPEPEYWWWYVKDYDALSARLKAVADAYGKVEVRFYGYES
jgi:hypothetical protein